MGSALTEEISKQDIDSEIRRLRKRRILPKRKAEMLEFLVEAKGKGDFEIIRGKTVLVQFEEKSNSRKYVTKQDINDAYQRARQLVRQLGVCLKEHYREPVLNASADVKILLAEYSDPLKEGHHLYEPQFSRLSHKVPSGDVGVSLVGDNVAAMNYVTERIPQVNRIEETFVRWIDRNSSLYTGSAFGEFLNALKDSKLLYRAILGPMTDKAVFSSGGLRDVLANREFSLPMEERSAKLYRLLHSTAIINFTLLYYVQDKSKFYKSTDDVEVLFGYGVHEPVEQAGTTKVFRSKNRDLVNEFQELFKALRSEEFSRVLDIDRPDLFLNEPRACDVLATFVTHPTVEIAFPTAQILRKITASGTGTGWTKRQPAQNASLKERRDDYVPDKPHIKICISSLTHLEGGKLKEGLKRALARGVQVSITWWAPGASFVDLRTRAIGLEADDALRELARVQSVLRYLGRHENLFIRECKAESSAVSIIWIDDLIYFSPYWIGKDVADGPHFLVTADSATGTEIREQYDKMIAASELMP